MLIQFLLSSEIGNILNKIEETMVSIRNILNKIEETMVSMLLFVLFSECDILSM